MRKEEGERTNSFPRCRFCPVQNRCAARGSSVNGVSRGLLTVTTSHAATFLRSWRHGRSAHQPQRFTEQTTHEHQRLSAPEARRSTDRTARTEPEPWRAYVTARITEARYRCFTTTLSVGTSQKPTTTRASQRRDAGSPAAPTTTPTRSS